MELTVKIYALHFLLISFAKHDVLKVAVSNIRIRFKYNVLLQKKRNASFYNSRESTSYDIRTEFLKI